MKKNYFRIGDYLNLVKVTNIMLKLWNEVFEPGELKEFVITFLSEIEVQPDEVRVKWNKTDDMIKK